MPAKSKKMKLNAFVKGLEGLPDDTKVPFGDTEYELGELREMLTESDTATSAEWTRIKRAQTDLDEANRQLADQIAAIQNAPGPAPNPAPNPNPNAPADELASYDNDAAFGPVVRKLRAYEAGFKTDLGGLRTEVATVAQGLRNLQSMAWMNRFETEYQINKPRLGDMTFEDTLKYAQEHNLLHPKLRVPSISAVADALEGAKTAEELASAKYEEGIQEGIRRQAAANLPRPGRPDSNSVFRTDIPSNKKEHLTPDQLLSRSIEQGFQDPEVIASVNRFTGPVN